MNAIIKLPSDVLKMSHAIARLVIIDGILQNELSMVPASGELVVSHQQNQLDITVQAPQKKLQLHLLYLSTCDQQITLQTKIKILAGSMLAILEEMISLPAVAAKLNLTTQLQCEATAQVDYIQFQHTNLTSLLEQKTVVAQANASQVVIFNLTLGAKQAAHEYQCNLLQNNAQLTLNGLFIAAQNQQHSFHTKIDHLAPHTESSEFFKGILAGSARGSFHGEVLVRPHAQKIISKQRNKNLLLSKDAQMFTLPTLEILANDVKCSHGATVGRLDEQQLFYLCSRGFSKTQAQQLLTQAFAYDLLTQISNPEIGQQLQKKLRQALSDTWFQQEAA